MFSPATASRLAPARLIVPMTPMFKRSLGEPGAPSDRPGEASHVMPAAAGPVKAAYRRNSRRRIGRLMRVGSAFVQLFAPGGRSFRHGEAVEFRARVGNLPELQRRTLDVDDGQRVHLG